MNFVKASQKISNCIDTATTKEHHYVIGNMIENVEKYSKLQKPWDKTIKGALAILYWQNVNKFGKLK